MAETQTKSTKGQDTEKAQERGKRAQPVHDQLKRAAQPEDSQGKQALAEMTVAEQASLVKSPQVFGAQRSEAVLGLQQTYGNKYVQRLAEGSKQAAPDEETIPRIEAQRGSGQPLEPGVRSQMEGAFGHNFGGVKIHTGFEADALSQQLEAKAFTTGKDIFFREGAYQPRSETGIKLIRHELTHVVQQESTQGREPRFSVGTIQRQPQDGEVEPVVEGKGAQPGPDMEDELRRLELIEGICAVRHESLNNYADLGMLVTDFLQTRLMSVSNTYKAAYGMYAEGIRAAAQEAREEQELIDIFVGLGLGVGLGVAALTIPVAAGVSAGGVALTVGTELAEVGATLGVKATGILDVAGKELEPGGLDPYLLRSKIWERLAKMYRGLHDVRPVQSLNTILWAVTERAIGETKLYLAGAETAKPRELLTEAISKIIGANEFLQERHPSFMSRMEILRAVGTKAASAPDYPFRKMLQDIWIMWISTLSYAQSDILDLWAIEMRLEVAGLIGPSSRLGVDFGAWTSKEDEVNAIISAVRKAHEIEARYKAITEGPV